MVERGRLIELIGTTVSGKTTFAKKLGCALGATTFFETTEGNPYMTDAHRGGKHSWDNQVWFLRKYVERLSEATTLVENGKIAIIDSGLPTYILHALPNLILHLTDTTDFLMERLKKRNKSYDDATPDFINKLTEFHNAWVTQTNLPVMTIRSRDLEHEGLKANIIRTIALTIQP